MANSRQILSRRRAAENISKVTGTMETISAVRYRQYYQQWAQGLAFYDALAQLAYLMATAETPIVHPLMQGSSSKNNALIVIGSDRGLCGAYNNDLFRQIDTHVKMARRFGRELKIYAKGRKVISYMDHQKIQPAGVYDQFTETPTAVQANQIGDFFMTPSGEEIFETLARMIVRASILGCFIEAATSEHLARVVNMRSATDNADEMIANLTKEYNRARQGQITTELLDIVSGMNAMK